MTADCRSNVVLLSCSGRTGLAIAIYGAAPVQAPAIAVPVAIKPAIYAALFCEFWIRPFKRKLERMLVASSAAAATLPTS